MRHRGVFGRIVLAAHVVVLGGCAPQVLAVKAVESHQIGQRLQAAPGGVILSSQSGNIKTVRKWVGLLNSPDGWETNSVRDSGYILKELLYAGISGTTVEIAYREYRGGLAAPAFYQSAKYDISTSREVTFQNFRIRIDSADNNGMTGVLLSDGKTSLSATGVAAASAQAGPAVAPMGKDVTSAESLARETCNSQPRANLTTKGPGYENYTIACTNGDSISVRCEYGNCRILK